ncbi:uncharacterized protein [Mytilus edulis]|uniref:uncharacterized protein n=1 Tax=Mytilus edulis TaxID=6550 RepID=UPI0039EDF737
MRNIILHDLVIPLLLALTFVCKADIYNMTWEVKKKVFHYGEDLSLSCCVHNCCQEAAGWGKWTNNELTTIFIDVKYLHVDNNSKYDGGINETEFLLVIRNITEFDLNINYSCTYGFKIGHKKMLLETDVFFEETTSDPIVTRKEGIPAYLIVVACVASVLVIVFAIVVFVVMKYITSKSRFRSKSDVSSYRTCRQSLEQDDVSNEETETTN